MQNLLGGLKNTDGIVSIFRVNLDQNASHFGSTAGKFCYCIGGVGNVEFHIIVKCEEPRQVSLQTSIGTAELAVCVPIFSCIVFVTFIEEVFPLCMPGR
jgi:hypothetical protein